MFFVCLPAFSGPKPRESFPPAVEKASRSVVKIIIEAPRKYFLGSGFFIGANLVATNFHVISAFDPQKKLHIFSRSQREIRFKRIIQLSALRDLAILEVEAGENSLSPLKLSKPIPLDQTPAGEVYALGFKKNSLFKTWGSHLKNQGDAYYFSFSGIDITQRPNGLSGGPMLNRAGEVIGVISSIAGNFIYGVQSIHLRSLLEEAPLPPHNPEALILLETARLNSLAREGNQKAQFQQGAALLKGVEPWLKDTEEGLEWLKAAARQNHAIAQYIAGRKLFNEAKTDKDYKKAFRLFIKAAENEMPLAQLMAGIMYWNGNGVKANAENASHWLQKAARQGDIIAKHIASREQKLGKRLKADQSGGGKPLKTKYLP